jgi:serine protease Do
MRGHFFLPLLGTLLSLSACGLQIEKHPLKEYPSIPEDSRPAPIGFNQIRYHIPTGTSVASVSPRGMFGIFQCGAPYKTIQQGRIGRYLVDDNMRQLFNDTMKSQGYDVTGDPGRLFDEDEDLMRTVYAVGARVTSLKMDVCDRKSFLFGHDLGFDGEGEIQIEWTVYDKLHRRNVYKTLTRGYAKQSIPNDEGLQLILEESFAAATHNLGADPVFRDLVVTGKTPTILPETMNDPDEEPLSAADPQEKISLPAAALSKSSAAPRMDDIRQTAVLVQAGVGHGSGFFISRDGYIVTNAHVVGYADKVRIVTSGKEDKIIASVVRRDDKRDVALLKIDDMTGIDHITALPIRAALPKVGEDVYAIGAPRLTKLQDTVTKGIISAVRYDKREKQTYIQGDVGTHGGSSGGPLIDANGNLLGLTVSGYDPTGYQLDAGLNNFIPIGEALTALNVTY